MNGWMNEWMDKQNFSPLYSTLSPIKAAAQKVMFSVETHKSFGCIRGCVCPTVHLSLVILVGPKKGKIMGPI